MMKLRGAAIAFMALMLGTAVPASAQTAPAPLNIGTLRIASQTPTWAAEKYGIFEKNGIKANFVFFNNGADGVNALQGRSVDVLLAIFGSGITAMSRGFDLAPIFQDEISRKTPPDTSGIQVLSDSGIKSLKDLVNKKLAVGGLHTQNTIAVTTLLKKSGVDIKSIRMVEIPFPAMFAALKAKTVDAVNAVDPFTTQIRMSGISDVLAYNYIETIPEQPLGVWFTRKSTLEANADVLARFTKSLEESADMLKADSAKARREIVEFTKLDASVVDAMPIANWNSQVDLKKWQAVIDMLIEAGDLPKGYTASSLITPILRPYVKP